jgi:hypothetical protein
VADRIRLYLVVRNDALVEVTDQWRREFDATRFRVKARVAAACPSLAKANRKLEVGTGGDTRSTKTATTAAGRSSSKA